MWILGFNIVFGTSEKKIFFCPIFIKITMSHYAEMKVNIYILPTNLPTLYSTKTFLSKKNKTLKLNLNKMFIIEKSTVLISLGMCNWFTLRQETNICLDYFIWNQNHLHLLGRLTGKFISALLCWAEIPELWSNWYHDHDDKSCKS